MRFLTLALLAVASTAAATPSWSEIRDNSDYSYADWKADFAPMLGASSAIQHSETAFNSNMQTIRAHNAKSTRTYTMGVNKFTAMTKQQFKDLIGQGYNRGAKPLLGNPHYHAKHADLTGHVDSSALPTAVDWRTLNVTTAVKDQGMCGGCWAFSAAETVESHVAIQTGALFILSEQEILACTPNTEHCGGTGGCSGATQELAFGYVASKGLTTEQAWPYKGSDSTCDWTGKTATVGIKDFVKLPTNNYTALLNSVQAMPIAISVAANAFQMYESGVLSNDACDTDVNHAVQLVGYGSDSKLGDYWTVRNSWGPSWGEKGYIRVGRAGEGSEPCDTDTRPGDGSGCQGGPASVEVCGTCAILADSSYPTGGFIEA